MDGRARRRARSRARRTPPSRSRPGRADLTWGNLDGEEHELIVEDADGNEIETSDESEQEGETVSITLGVTEEMVGRSGTYYCEYHPEAMRGEFSVE